MNGKGEGEKGVAQNAEESSVLLLLQGREKSEPTSLILLTASDFVEAPRGHCHTCRGAGQLVVQARPAVVGPDGPGNRGAKDARVGESPLTPKETNSATMNRAARCLRWR